MDKLAAMQVFVKVVELGSFSRAAEALDLSRTMTTTHVARLEEQLQVRLLNRTTRRLSLTEAGRAYYERGSALLADLQGLEASLQAMSEQPAGVLRITAPVSFGRLHLAPVLAEYLDRYPRVRLDVSLNDRTVDLVEEGYDLAIRITRLADSSLIARRLATMHIKLCASPTYLRRRGAPSVPADLASHDCLGYAYAGTASVWTLEGPEGLVEARVHPETRANNGELLRELALHGHGIVLMPAFLLSDHLAKGELVEVLPDYSAGELGVFALYASRKYLSAKVRTLVDLLSERFAASSW